MWKNGTDEPICRQEQRHRHREETCGYSGGKRVNDERVALKHTYYHM